MASTEQQQKPSLPAHASRCHANSRPLQLPKPLVRLTLLLLVSLSAPFLNAAQPVAPENHRITLRTLDPNAVPVGQWRMKVWAYYYPLEEGAPNTTVTTTSRDNCKGSGAFNRGWSLRQCTNTYNRTVSRSLPAAQMRAANARTLNLDFAPVVEDQGAAFGITDVVLEYATCPKGCVVERVELGLSCWGEEVDPGEVVDNGMVMSYTHGAKANPATAKCGLQAPDTGTWTNRSNRAKVMQYVRGHFGDEQHTFSKDMLTLFAAIPTRDGDWQWNPAQKPVPLYNNCPVAKGEYLVHSDLRASLPVSVGWPYHNEVDVSLTSKPNGEVCTVKLSGTGDELYRGYVYTFENGQLKHVSTDNEPGDVTREWRWVNGEPWEYTRRVPGSGAGIAADKVVYWHRTAAQLWPERMDYSPDLKEFAALNKLAREMAERFGK